MEQQCKKVYDKALEIYKAEIGSATSMSAGKKTHQHLEDELRKYLQKEMKGYSKLSEITTKLMVMITMINRSNYVKSTRSRRKSLN
jgi:hypothetical protein